MHVSWENVWKSLETWKKMRYDFAVNWPFFDQTFREQILLMVWQRWKLQILLQRTFLIMVDCFWAWLKWQNLHQWILKKFTLILLSFSCRSNPVRTFRLSYWSHFGKEGLCWILANGIKARAEYYVQYTNGGIELARALYRTELEKSDREDYSEMLFGFAQFTINNKLNDELQHAIEK